MVQQGEAQNNDCLFVVFLLAVIIAPPPLIRMPPDARASMPAHTCTHLHTRRNAFTLLQACAHTHTQTHASHFNENFHVCISGDLWFLPEQTVTDTCGENMEFKKMFSEIWKMKMQDWWWWWWGLCILHCHVIWGLQHAHFRGNYDSIGRTVSFCIMPYCIQWLNQHKLSKISCSPIGKKNMFLYRNKTIWAAAIKDRFDLRWCPKLRRFSCP